MVYPESNFPDPQYTDEYNYYANDPVFDKFAPWKIRESATVPWEAPMTSQPLFDLGLHILDQALATDEVASSTTTTTTTSSTTTSTTTSTSTTTTTSSSTTTFLPRLGAGLPMTGAGYPTTGAG